MTSKTNFSDDEHQGVSLQSSWRGTAKTAEFECQTEPELYEFVENEIQSGISTSVVQVEISTKLSGMGLAAALAKLKKSASLDEWSQRCANGKITVDGDVVTDPSFKMEEDFFIEYVDFKKDACVGTDLKDSRDATASDLEGNPELSNFLRRVVPIVERQLDENTTSRAFDGYHTSMQSTVPVVHLWNSLSVDLEKHKVLFPDWNSGSFLPGVIVHCSLTRNKEKVYDVEYRDSGVYDRINGIRGEYIRVIEDSNVRTAATMASAKNAAPFAIKEGIRVHVRVSDTKKGSSGTAKYVPGRITSVSKNGTVDIECGDRVLSGLTSKDFTVGLEVGYNVEARQPLHNQLQSTGVSWSCAGGAVAVSYGRNDITGWCDLPGAICVWTIFDKLFDPKEPQFVFDHPSCIMCVKFHPLIPSIVAGGSFNGEVGIWNLNDPEKVTALSTIDSIFSHREPVMDINWIYESELRKYLLCSLGADGRLLFWDIDNRLVCPIRGVLISRPKEKRGQYPSAYGGTCLSFSYGASHRAEWVFAGQEGGEIARGMMSRILATSRVFEESAGRNPNGDDIYQSMRRSEDKFSFDNHVGPVQSIDCSPFHRNLFLTGGSDGIVRLYHALDRRAVLEWEPTAPPGTPGISGKLFGSVTAVKFSPVSPVVFATASSEGFVFFFNLIVSTSGPVLCLTIPLVTSASSGRAHGGRGGDAGTATSGRPAVTGISFNAKQRDMFAACDSLGRVHIWRLDRSLSTSGANDQAEIDKIGRINATTEDI